MLPHLKVCGLGDEKTDAYLSTLPTDQTTVDKSKNFRKDFIEQPSTQNRTRIMRRNSSSRSVNVASAPCLSSGGNIPAR